MIRDVTIQLAFQRRLSVGLGLVSGLQACRAVTHDADVWDPKVVACVSALWIDASWDLRTTVSSVDCRIEGSEQIFLNSRSSLGP